MIPVNLTKLKTGWNQDGEDWYYIKDGKPTRSLIRTTYLIDENGMIVRGFGSVKPKENAEQMLMAL